MTLEVSSTKRQKSDVQASIDVQAPTNPNNLGRFPSVLLIEIFSHFIFFGTEGKMRAENIQQIVALRHTNKTCNAALKNWLAEKAICFMREDIRFLRGIKQQIFPNVQQLMLALPYGTEVVNANTHGANYFFSPSLKTPNVRVLHVPALPSVITALAHMPKLEKLFLQIACLGTNILLHEEEGTSIFISALNNCLTANAPLEALCLEDMSDIGEHGELPFQSVESLIHLGNTPIASQLIKIGWVINDNDLEKNDPEDTDELLELAKKCTNLRTLIIYDHTRRDVITSHDGHLTAFAEGCPTLTEIEYYGNSDNQGVVRNLFRKQGADIPDTALRFLKNLRKLKLENMQPDGPLYDDIMEYCQNLESLTIPMGLVATISYAHLKLLPKLSYIKISNVIDTARVHPLLDMYFPNLKEISIGVGVSKERVDRFLRTLAVSYNSRLTELTSVPAQAHISKFTSVHLAASFPNLTHISADNGARLDLRPYRHPLLEKKSS